MKDNLKFGYCCKEKSIITKVYNGGKRVEYCINRGCGYKQDLPPIPKEKEK